MEMNFETFKESLFSMSRTMGPVLAETDAGNGWNRNRLDVESALALKNIFFYLGIIFRYPTEQIYSEIEDHLAAFADFFCDYGGSVPKLPPIEDLQSEYISLFVTNKGFVPAAPYASCYQGDGMLISENFYRLKQIMMASGFMLEDSVKELEDHLAVLLELCSNLLNTLVTKNNSDKNVQACLYALMEISYRYIEPLVEIFSDKINTYADYDFYKVAGKALQSLFHDADTIYIQLLGFQK